MTKTIPKINPLADHATECPTKCPTCETRSFVRPNTVESKLQALVTPSGLTKMAAYVGRVFSAGEVSEYGALLRCEKCRKPVLACPYCHKEFHPPGALPPEHSRRTCMKCDQQIAVMHGIREWVDHEGMTHE